MRNIDDMFKYMKNKPGNKWVVQKYMENPLIIQRRKFDIRQWVLVSNWNPLTVWANKNSYLRYAEADYDWNNVSNLSHLTNDCLVKEHLDKNWMQESDN